MIVEMVLKLQEELNTKNSEKLGLLRLLLKSMKRVCVAYSGGVDSSLVAAIAYEQLGEKAFAITGVSDSLAPYLLEEARQQALWLGIKHKECNTHEINKPDYYQNPINRCFACKQELHSHVSKIAKAHKGCRVIDGVNFDDIKEYRPGIQAAKIAGVQSPLADLEIEKSSIREISKALGLPWWDKPSQPCLASRFPYGEGITSKRLQQVAKAEKWLINNGFPKVRVRVQGMSASIEIPSNRINDLVLHANRKELVNYFLSIGFNSVNIDLEGLISGKLNRVLAK